MLWQPRGLIQPPVNWRRGQGVTAVPLSLDGSDPQHLASNGPLVFSLSTSNANDVIMVVVMAFSSQDLIGPTCAGSTLGSFTSRATFFDAADSSTFYSWWKHAASPLSSETITVTLTGANGSFITGTAFGVTGADTTSPFDGTLQTGAASASPISITPSAADTFVFGAVGGGTAAPGAGAGWTAIHNGDFYVCEYQILSAAAAKSLTVNAGGYLFGSYADAIVKAP